MYLTTNLCALTLRQVIGGVCSVTGVQVGEGAVGGVVRFLTKHFIDQSQRLTAALAYSNGRAWRALELALTGDSVWDRCKRVFARSDEKAFREQVQPFLKACPLAELQGRDAFREACLAELQSANGAGLLQTGSLDPEQLAQKAGAFARFNSPTKVLDAESEALEQMGDELREQGYANLAEFITLRPKKKGPPLLVLAARYFFRRAVEDDPALFQGLTFTQLDGLQKRQEAGFESLSRLLDEHAEKLDKVLSDIAVTVTATHDVVLDLQNEQQRQGTQNREIYDAVLDLQHRFDMVQREVRPTDSLSIRNDNERRIVKEIVGRYRGLPEEQRGELPALLNAIGKLEIAAGEFENAQADFAAVAELVEDPKARAEAHANAYHAALEQRNWDKALEELQRAIELDAERFSPFPTDKYIPERILGAGGFGVAFLCRHRFLKTDVVVKALLDRDLDRGIDDIFVEAQAIRQLDHQAIVRLQDCGFAHDDARPYLVMDHFDGVTLDAYARETPLSPDDLLWIARQMASGLKAAHDKGILHRDIKPANLLVRAPRDKDDLWHVKLIDFGLALRKSNRETLMASASSTIAGSSIAGTLEYAAPEQMGKLPGVEVSPASDVYGFGRTCCFALFQTPQPLPRHWRRLPTQLGDLLESCLEENPKDRPRDFAAVLKQLGGATPEATKTSLPVATTASTVPAPSTKPVAEMTEGERIQELELLHQRVSACVRCSQLAFSRTQTVFGTGPLDAKMLFLGEAPGADEDRRGEPFIGAAGQVLTNLILELGMRREDVYLCNILRCRPPGNRKPQEIEVRNCQEYLNRQIELVRPRAIVALGGTAAQNLLRTPETIGRLRGRLYSYEGVPVLCTYHPAFLLPGRSPERRKDVLGDLKMLLRR